MYYGPDEALVSLAKPNKTGLLMMMSGLVLTILAALVYKRKAQGYRG